MTAEENVPESLEYHNSEPAVNMAQQQQPVPQPPQPIPFHNSTALMAVVIAVLVAIVAFLLGKVL